MDVAVSGSIILQGLRKMTFQSIDKRRLSYLLGFGTQEGELKKFFDDSLKALMLRGARIRNAPHGNAARIKLISERLPATTDEVLRQWFSKNITVVDPLSPHKLIEVFEGHEASNTSPTKEEAPHLARSCLFHLFADGASEEFLDFLRTPIPGARQVESAAVTEVLTTETDENNSQVMSHSDLLTLLASAFEGSDLGDVLDQLPEDLASFVEGLSRIRRGDERSAQDALSLLSPDSEEAKLLARSIKRMRSVGKIPISQQGFLVSPSSEFQGDADTARLQVFAYCTNDRPTATFVKPIGVIRHGTLETFSDDQREQFFPETGDVMAFSGPGRPRQPTRGEVGIWDIEEHPTEKRTRCHITKEGAELYYVVTVPVHSSDADSVRSYIKKNFEIGAAARKNRLYELLDGVIISPQNFRADLSRDETYEQPFNRWTQLVGFSFEGQRLVVGPLPHADSKYDCAPIFGAVRSMLRTLRDQQKVQLTRGQIRDVVALFQDGDDVVSRQRMARIVERAEAAQMEEAVINDMLEFALEAPALRQRIDDGVRQRIDQRFREKDDLQSELARLLSERTAAESRLRSAEKAARKQARETADLVKEVFDRAVTNGIETLVSARIFETLNGSAIKVPTQPQETGRHEEQSRLNVLPRVDRDSALQVLKACGLNRRFSVLLISAVMAACRVGIVVFLRGEFARQVIGTIARIEREAVSFDVPMGMLGRSSDIAQAILSDRPVAILNANLSDFELYASEITDRILMRIAGQSVGSDFSVMGSLADGDLTIPLPPSIRRYSLTIDIKWSDDYQLSNGEQSADFEDLNENLKLSSLNQALAESLLAEIEQLPLVEQAGVVSVIKKAIEVD